MADVPEKPAKPDKTAKTEPADATPQKPPQGRRDFFAEAFRGTITPLTGLVERRIKPLLTALEDIPRQAEMLANSAIPLDQPQVAGARSYPLPQSHPLNPERILRPPGALPPGEFENTCTCGGECVRACPANAIRIDSNGLVADGLPYIVAADQPCVVCESLACMKTCPSGALKLVEISAIRMGTAKVNHTICRRNSGEDCRLCIEACPLGETAITISAESGKVRVKRDGCIGCGLCESRCPTEPRAITVVPWRPNVEPMIA